MKLQSINGELWSGRTLLCVSGLSEYVLVAPALLIFINILDTRATDIG